jgi:hypothetical protein
MVLGTREEAAAPLVRKSDKCKTLQSDAGEWLLEARQGWPSLWLHTSTRKYFQLVIYPSLWHYLRFNNLNVSCVRACSVPPSLMNPLLVHSSLFQSIAT